MGRKSKINKKKQRRSNKGLNNLKKQKYPNSVDETSQYLCQPNFETVGNSEAFRLTSEMLKKAIENAQSEGRQYVWTPLDIDYWIPEKTDFEYEYVCPNFAIFQSSQKHDKSISVDVIGIFDLGQTGYLYRGNFVRVFQKKGELKEKELVDIARMFAYMRFYLRDRNRDLDTKWWNQFFSTHVVSNETVMICHEDKLASLEWANQIFPNNAYNAWIGKCGEFVFASWAGEYALPVSRVDLKNHSERTDEYDFSHTMLFGNKVKIDVKTFQVEKDNKRNWWNVSDNCLEGNHKQDIFVFIIVDEIFQIGKVVGFLTAEDIKRKGDYRTFYDECNPYDRGYYRIRLEDIQNPYYLRAFFDSKNQIFNGLGFGVAPQEVITQMIKDYPLDPIVAYNLGYKDWLITKPGGMKNLVAKPTLQMFINF